jgi:hypothetical protein
MFKISIPSFETVKGWFTCFMTSFKMIQSILYPPRIDVKPLGEVRGTWKFQISNACGGRPLPRLFLEDITSGQGKPTGEVTSAIEVGDDAWSVEPSPLFGLARRVYGISVGVMDITIRAVLLRQGLKSIDLMHFQLPPMDDEVRLVFRVVFYSDEAPNRELMDDGFTCIVRRSSNGFVVRLVKRARR